MTQGPSPFAASEIVAAAVVAAVIQVTFFMILILAGTARAHIKAEKPPEPTEEPIAVKPVMDELPLLKLGGKKMRPKLPDMWKKQPPIPIERFEEASAPSEFAEDDPDEIPTSEVAKGDAAPPPPDADLAKETIEVEDAGKPPEETAEGPGAADGVKEGTETDPLKAHAMSIYRSKLIGWFDSKFRPPTGQIPCEELKKLSSTATATVSPDGTVTGFSIGAASGNGAFDQAVRAALQSAVGQQVPPPPKNYPNALPPSISLNFNRRNHKCE